MKKLTLQDQGSASNPITITRYQNDDVVIDGSRALSELGAATGTVTGAGHPACLCVIKLPSTLSYSLPMVRR